MPVLLLFFASGATALVYEVLWSKYLSLIFGSTVQAQTVVLAVFMGGLALGNRLVGRRADLLRQPLAAYGCVELAIGLYAFFFPQLYSMADGIFISVGTKVVEQSALLLILKGALSIALLIVPTVLMGGTLPLLAAWLQQRSRDAARSSTIFYSVNSLGAVLGSGVAGFYLVRVWGMVASLQLTALVNLIIGVAAVLISRRAAAAEEITPTAEPVQETQSTPKISPRQACALVAITGGISMGLEVLASRAVGLLVGGSLQAFAIVLMAFILGIGIGGACIGRRKSGDRWLGPAAVCYLLLGASVLVFSFVGFIKNWSIAYSYARYAIAPNSAGYFMHQLLVAGIALGALGLPAGLIGATLPLCIRLVSTGRQTLGEQIGRLLTWNTVGAVTGVLITGFVLMPMLGLRGALITMSALLAIAAAGLAFRFEKTLLLGASGSVTLVVLLAGLVGGHGWQHILGAGLYRLRDSVATSEFIERRQNTVQIKYYKDAADATVAVETSTKPNQPPQLILRINGKTDASTYGDLSTQYLLGHLPMLAHPGSQDVFILGFGSGITAGAVLSHPLKSLDIAENCAPVMEAAPLFSQWNRDAHKNPLARIWTEDARTILKLRPKYYDVIISEPSNPWVPGIGSVFSQEFYRLCSSRLKQGGVMAQWFHIYEMHDGIVNLVIRTFSSVFPNVEIWDSESGDIILLGSNQPWESTPEVFQKSFAHAAVAKDLTEIGLASPRLVLARQLASQRTARHIPGDGPIQQDEFPVLEYAAPQAFFIGQTANQVFDYDERTFQSPLATTAKRQTLATLTDAELESVFTNYGTSNPLLSQYLKWRARDHATNAVFADAPLLPVIFRQPATYPEQPEIPPKASATARELTLLEARLFGSRVEALPVAVQIEEILRRPPPALPATQDWNPVRYSALVAKFYLAGGRPESAATVVQNGLKLAPTDTELLYLSRLAPPSPPPTPK